MKLEEGCIYKSLAAQTISDRACGLNFHFPIAVFFLYSVGETPQAVLKDFTAVDRIFILFMLFQTWKIRNHIALGHFNPPVNVIAAAFSVLYFSSLLIFIPHSLQCCFLLRWLYYISGTDDR